MLSFCAFNLAFQWEALLYPLSLDSLAAACAVVVALSSLSSFTAVLCPSHQRIVPFYQQGDDPREPLPLKKDRLGLVEPLYHCQPVK